VNRVSGFQAYLQLLVRQLETGREQLSPHDYAVLIDVVGRWVDTERKRLERALKRWAA
jgi:hypothetical protein